MARRVQENSTVATQPYDTARFLIEPINARKILAPEELDHDPQTRTRAHEAFASAPGVPQPDTGASLLEELLSSLGGAPVARTHDALEAMSVLPSTRFTSKLKAVAAMAASRLYAAESMAYRTAGGILEGIGSRPTLIDLQTALRALPVEYVVTRRYAFENLTAATDRLLEELRKANPYLRILLRDARPRTAADRGAIAQMVLDRCEAGGQGSGLAALSPEQFPALAVRRDGSPGHERPDWILGQEQMAVESAKLLGARVLTLLRAVDHPLPEEINERLLDLMIQIYALDSSVVRTVQLLKARGIEKAKVQCDLTALHAAEATAAIRNTGRRLLRHYTGPGGTRDLIAGLSIISGRDLDGTSDRVVAHFVEAGLARV